MGFGWHRLSAVAAVRYASGRLRQLSTFLGLGNSQVGRLEPRIEDCDFALASGQAGAF
jgi:hypothetical protein